MIKRTIAVKTDNTGQLLDIGGSTVTMDGSTYTLTENKTEGTADLELGVENPDRDFYRVALSSQSTFLQLAASAGILGPELAMGSWVPFMQGSVGVGYEGGGALPDNIMVGVGLGLQCALGDSLYGVFSAMYIHRYWQEIDQSYGKEKWQDDEGAARLGIRYLF